MSDTFGGRIGWTVEHSQSGYQAVRHHLAAQRAAHYAQWVGPLVTPRRVIDAVLAGEIDVGPLDSYVHDLLKRHEPETAAKLRVVEFDRDDADPAAGRVARRRATMRSRDCATRCSPAIASPRWPPTRDTLLLSRFAAVEPEDYDVLLERRG